MDHESTELNITFILILALVLFFAYSAIPKHDPDAHHAVADASHAEVVADAHADEEASHDAEPEKAHAEEASHDKPAAAPAKETTAAAPAADGFDLIAMNNPIYPKHKKAIVMFTHRKHIDDYQIGCGDCHHDDKGAPLELKEGDPVQSCAECHKETEKPKGEKLSKEEKIMKYHMEALHANCIGCHKEYNIEKGDPKGKKPAPVSCTTCHPKPKKK